MRQITITIPGVPIAKKRHRTAKGKTYNPQTQEERAVRWEIKKNLVAGHNLLKEPLILTCNAFFPRPKSHYGSGRNAGKVKQSAPKHHTNKPDFDNIAKFYMDAMNKLVFLDDTQVVGFGEGRKHWVDKEELGRVELRLEVIEG